MSELVKRLKALLIEKFNIQPENIRLLTPSPTEKWEIGVNLFPTRLYEISIVAYEDGKIEIGVVTRYTSESVGDWIRKKYQRRRIEAKKGEEKERITDEYLKERERIIENFKQQKFGKYLKVRGRISYFAKVHMWDYEVSKRICNKYGLDVVFDVDSKSGFVTSFNSTGMSDDQIIDELLRRVDAIVEAKDMSQSKEMMNEFLKSRGIEVEEPKRRRANRRGRL